MDRRVRSSLKICQGTGDSGIRGGGAHVESQGGGSGQLLPISGLEHHRRAFCQAELLSFLPTRHFLPQKIEKVRSLWRWGPSPRLRAPCPGVFGGGGGGSGERCRPTCWVELVPVGTRFPKKRLDVQ